MSKLTKIFIGVFLLIIITGVVQAKQIATQKVSAVQETVEPEPAPLSPIEYADKYATQYGIDLALFKKVMWCESNNEPTAVGDSGKARNVLQFHKGTFIDYSKKLGKDMDYNSYKDQTELGAYMFSIGQARHWTSYRAIMNGGVYTFTDSEGKTHTVHCKL